jgi:hypothetical protein
METKRRTKMGAPMKKRSKLPALSFCSDRRFGIELELNAFDGKNRPDPGQKPAGIEHIAMVVARNTREGVDIREWEHTQNNENWVIKPDSSCGMEVCTPVYKGWNGIKKVVDVVKAFQEDKQIKADHRTSVHVHIEVADLTSEQLASVIAHWFKCEPVFMDSVPASRKMNRYCQFMAFNNLVQVEQKIVPGDLIKRVGTVKYYSLNTKQMMQNGRKTIEFRIGEGEGCRDPYLIKNWTRLLLQFVERAKNMPIPGPYVEGDQWSSFCLLDPRDVFKVLGFDPNEYELSPGLAQTRNWLMARIQRHMNRDGFRALAHPEFEAMLAEYKEAGVTITPEEHLHPADLKTALYQEDLAV